MAARPLPTGFGRVLLRRDAPFKSADLKIVFHVTTVLSMSRVDSGHAASKSKPPRLAPLRTSSQASLSQSSPVKKGWHVHSACALAPAADGFVEKRLASPPPHDVHTALLDDAENVPAGQSVHLIWPAAANEPGGQASQRLAPVSNVPAAQGVHAPAP
jgi:hypothetical protein